MTWLSGKIAAYVTGGLLVIIVGLALALTITRGTLKSRTEKLAASNAQLAAESNAHRVTLASLAQCQSTLAEKSAESDARAKALADSTAGYQADLAELKKQSAGQAEKLAYWQGMADKYQAAGKCPISADLAKELNR